MGGCPWCNAPRADGPTCPRCGANYAKAELIRKQGRAAVAAPPVTPPAPAVAAYAEPEDRVEDAALEYKFCVAAIPAALALAVLLSAFGFSRAVLRLPFTMPVHELGHAVSAWFCGFMAIPTLWKTIVPEERGFVAPVLLFAGLGVALVLLQGFGTFGILFFGEKTQLYKGSLRWGFLVIGAIAFVEALVRRYLLLVGSTCLAALAAVYAWGVWRARQIGSS
ncbi:MAG: hypothetical protein ACT4P4_11985 [Betaproteobacteria bacterium]